VDAISHALFGQTLGVALVRRPRPLGVMAGLVLGSLLPDIDIALAPRAFDLYLRAHAAGTHALAGSLAGALLLAAALRTVLRQSRFWPLFWASWAGTIGHIFWDLADGGDIKVFDPLSGALFGWHLVAMAEPAVLVPLFVAALIAWKWPSRARPVGAAALGILITVLSAKIISQATAHAHYSRVAATRQPESAEMIPVRGSLFRWTIYDRVDDQVRAWRADSWSGAVEIEFERPDAGASPLAAASRELPVVRTFLGLTGIPFARVENDGARRIALWSDIRWCSKVGCDVSFGGAFDGAMRPLYQIIRVGGFQQTRPVGR
jgi:membrane-bound metal-dependent hydrolase YbcI (DUF457 family)